MRAMSCAALLLGGCTGDPNTKDDIGDMPYCEETATVVALDEATELGFAAAEILALAGGTHDETFTWDRDGSTTALTLTVTHSGGEARFVDEEAVYPEDGGPAIAVICEDHVELDVDITFVTADGSFDEAWSLPLTSTDGTAAGISQSLDPDALGGTYDMETDIGGEPYDDRSLWMSGTFDATGAGGEIAGQISGEDDCDEGEACSAWAAQVPVGAWGLTER